MEQTRLFNSLGLCRRAGKCQSGDFAASRAVESGKAKLMLLEQAAAEATKDKYAALCTRHSVPLVLVPEVGKAIGKPGHIVMAVTDAGFARMIQDALASETQVGG